MKYQYKIGAFSGIYLENISLLCSSPVERHGVLIPQQIGRASALWAADCSGSAERHGGADPAADRQGISSPVSSSVERHGGAGPAADRQGISSPVSSSVERYGGTNPAADR